jgi:alkylation response protein AidB-like acyl-CoA dehydrogenase
MTTTSASTEQLVRDRARQLVADHDPRTTPPTEFWGAQFDAGLAWVSFPEGSGGLGVTPKLQETADAVLRAAGAPTNFLRNPIGVGMAAGTILAHGRPEQVERHLRPLFTCEEVWCQLFSEPGAGSDLAGLSSRAVRDGDEWVVNGQKVWTTLAHMARFGLLVTRTDPEAPKHRGLTYFIVDMHAPGVEVRPLRQITGEAEFNEVYLTDVRIPDSSRLGDVGDGWRVSLTTLMNERVAIGGGVSPRGSGPIAQAVRVWNEQHGRDGDPALRDRLMQFWVSAEVARLTNLRAQANRSKGTPGPEGSIGKIMAADLNKAITAFTVNLLGMEGTLYGSYAMVRPEEAALSGSDAHKNFLRSRANSIEGGTSEIMRNILGERVLGLPGEPRVDKDLPWSKVPRS